MSKQRWFAPDEIPAVPEGEEVLFWIAVRSISFDGAVLEYTRLAHYQNRPLYLDDDGEPTVDDHLTNTDGEAVESIRWVNSTEHEEFENYYTPIHFSDSYELVAWSFLATPDFPTIEI